MQPLPQLPEEHEVYTVKNTFVEVKEKPRSVIQRAGTAPASSLVDPGSSDEETDEHPMGDVRSRWHARMSTVVSEPEDMHVDELPESLPDSSSQPSLSSQRTTSSLGSQPDAERTITPDMWERQTMTASKPSYRRMDTPDTWEREAILQSDLQPSASPQEPLAAQYPSGLVQAAQVHISQVFPYPASSPHVMPQMLVVPQSGHAWHVAPVVTPPLSPLPSPSQTVVSQHQPILLGRTSVAEVTAQDEKSLPEPEADALAPGALECETLPSGKVRVRWNVDGQRLDSNSEKLLSPEFQLTLPDQEAQPFRLMILAKQTGGKHGAGFRKAKGRGSIEVKCLGSLPDGLPCTAMRLSVGSGNRRQKAQKLVWHNFSEKNCCHLPKGDDPDWDLKACVSKDTKCFEICVEVVRHSQDGMR
eukprot:TRINITY_DN16574_c0_g1_i1.p1 TRINITY_DN16574_c0_g1~~TRINITY_DN16574_c0_g1_i1.p1  ORF type:complete len:416 (+),score=75.13 TRINITY_DN16574_c0_g1_i1:80-1327(+)